jgi:HEAT repeats
MSSGIASAQRSMCMVFCSAVALAVLMDRLSAQPGDELYEGRPLGSWLDATRAPDVQERRQAIRVLSRNQHQRDSTVPALYGALNDPDEEIRREASNGLAALRPSVLEEDPSPWVTAALLSRASGTIIADETGVTLEARGSFYHFDSTGARWSVANDTTIADRGGRTSQGFALEFPRTGEPVAVYFDSLRGSTYHFTFACAGDSARLLVGRVEGDSIASVASAGVWSSEDVRRAYSDDPELAQAKRICEMSLPGIRDVFDDGTNLWLSTGFYAGEGGMGIGALIRCEPARGLVTSFVLPEVATTSISRLVATRQRIWFGTRHDGECWTGPAKGLVCLDAENGRARFLTPESSPIVGRLVTALRLVGDALWIATDEGICRVALPEETWRCWRIVPVIALDERTPVSDRPGGRPRRWLPAGVHEVRWAKPGYFLVVTADSMEGWMETEWVDEFRRRDFEKDAWYMQNTYMGGPIPMSLRDRPDDDAETSAQAYRTVLESVADSGGSSGWTRVRAHTGWIDRASRRVEIVLSPVP